MGRVTTLDRIDEAVLAVGEAILPLLPKQWQQRSLRQDLEISDPLEALDDALQFAAVENLQAPTGVCVNTLTMLDVIDADSLDARRIEMWLGRVRFSADGESGLETSST